MHVIFSDLPLIWKILIIIGSICCFLFILSLILIILIFKSDIIPIDFIINSKTNVDEFNDILNEWDPKPTKKHKKTRKPPHLQITDTEINKDKTPDKISENDPPKLNTEYKFINKSHSF